MRYEVEGRVRARSEPIFSRSEDSAQANSEDDEPSWESGSALDGGERSEENDTSYGTYTPPSTDHSDDEQEAGGGSSDDAPRSNDQDHGQQEVEQRGYVGWLIIGDSPPLQYAEPHRMRPEHQCPAQMPAQFAQPQSVQPHFTQPQNDQLDHMQPQSREPYRTQSQSVAMGGPSSGEVPSFGERPHVRARPRFGKVPSSRGTRGRQIDIRQLQSWRKYSQPREKKLRKEKEGQEEETHERQDDSIAEAPASIAKTPDVVTSSQALAESMVGADPPEPLPFGSALSFSSSSVRLASDELDLGMPTEESMKRGKNKRKGSGHAQKSDKGAGSVPGPPHPSTPAQNTAGAQDTVISIEFDNTGPDGPSPSPRPSPHRSPPAQANMGQLTNVEDVPVMPGGDDLDDFADLSLQDEAPMPKSGNCHESDLHEPDLDSLPLESPEQDKTSPSDSADDESDEIEADDNVNDPGPAAAQGHWSDPVPPRFSHINNVSNGFPRKFANLYRPKGSALWNKRQVSRPVASKLQILRPEASQASEVRLRRLQTSNLTALQKYGVRTDSTTRGPVYESHIQHYPNKNSPEPHKLPWSMHPNCCIQLMTGFVNARMTGFHTPQPFYYAHEMTFEQYNWAYKQLTLAKARHARDKQNDQSYRRSQSKSDEGLESGRADSVQGALVEKQE